MKTWLQVVDIIRLMHKPEQLPGKPYPYLYWQIVFRSITTNTLEKINHRTDPLKSSRSCQFGSAWSLSLIHI